MKPIQNNPNRSHPETLTEKAITRRRILTSSLILASASSTLPLIAGTLLPTQRAFANDRAVSLNPLYYPLESFIPEIDLTGKIAVITGASRGIGRAAGEALSNWGVEVIGTSRDAAHVPNPPDFLLMDLDVSDASSIAKFAKTLERELNGRKLDILINNGGRFVIGPMVSEDKLSGYFFDQMQLATDTIHLGHIKVTHALLPMMPNQGYARLLYTVSSASYTTGGTDLLTPWVQPYISSKRALLAFANSLRYTHEAASSNLKISTVNPYVIATQGAEHPNPIYMQPVSDTGFTDDPPDAPFNQILQLIRQLQSSGLPPEFVGRAYAQLLASSAPPANVVVASTQYPYDLQGGNALVEGLILSENLESAIRYDCA